MNASTNLHFTPVTVADVPFQVLDNAYWRPQAAKLHGKHKDSLAADPHAVAEKTYQKLAGSWRKEETWINHALNALLSALPEAVLATLVAELCGGMEVDEAGRPGLRHPGEDDVRAR